MPGFGRMCIVTLLHRSYFTHGNVFKKKKSHNGLKLTFIIGDLYRIVIVLFLCMIK